HRDRQRAAVAPFVVDRRAYSPLRADDRAGVRVHVVRQRARDILDRGVLRTLPRVAGTQAQRVTAATARLTGAGASKRRHGGARWMVACHGLIRWSPALATMRPARRQPRHGNTGSRRRKSPPWPRR